MKCWISKLGYWSAISAALLVILIDAGMILSFLLLPSITQINSIQAYAAGFSDVQMFPFLPSLLLAPTFLIFMLSIHYRTSEEKKALSHLGVAFALVCATILRIHYYLQLTLVRQGVLSGKIEGLWLFVSPNPNSMFWTLAALGYGFMGLVLFFAAPTFDNGKREDQIKWLFILNAFLGFAMVVGNAVGVFAANIFVSFAWGVLFPIAAILVGLVFKKDHAMLGILDEKKEV